MTLSHHWSKNGKQGKTHTAKAAKHLKNKTVNILEFPSNLGLKKNATTSEPGVVKLPGWLKKHGFHDGIRPENLVHLGAFPYATDMDEESGVRNAGKILRYAKEQARILDNYLNHKSFQVILGGDCSILIGNALALKRKGTYGLLFIDGHTDFIPPNLSHTGGAAGMDLAIATGYGHPKLTNIDGLEPYFEEANVYCLGNREYTPEYVRPVLNSDVAYFNLKNLRTNGMERTSLQFLDMIDEKKLDGFFIHLDVDVLNDKIMPAVDSRQQDGLTYAELSQILVPVLSSPQATGIEITILDPDLDKDGTCTSGFIGCFLDIIKTVR